MNASPPPAIRLVVVDDHQVVRMGLRSLLSQTAGLEVVAEAATVTEAVEAAARWTPDVVLLDVRLGQESGFEACRRIQALPGTIRVLILTSYADDNVVLEAIQAGADGYLLKEIGSEALIAAIRQVAAGQSILDPNVTKWVLGRIKAGASPGGSAPHLLDALSVQERRVLALVAEGKTNKEVAAALALSDKTVKNYFSNILDKLQLTRRSQAAAFYVQHTRS